MTFPNFSARATDAGATITIAQRQTGQTVLLIESRNSDAVQSAIDEIMRDAEAAGEVLIRSRGPIRIAGGHVGAVEIEVARPTSLATILEQRAALLRVLTA